MRHMGIGCLLLGLFLGGFILPGSAVADPPTLEEYLLSFDYADRREMKISSKELLVSLVEGEVVLVDIRFAEEHAAWGVGFGLKIPLNELPRRLAEIPRDKIIVTACPLKDRAIIAMAYLRTQGFETRYLTDGLLGLVNNLRGDNAKLFMRLLAEENAGES